MSGRNMKDSIYSAIVKNGFLPLSQLYAGDSSYSGYKELIASQGKTKAEIQKIQLSRLKNILKHAYDSVPMYREIFKARGITPDDIKNMDDIALLPPISRHDFRARYPDQCTSASVPRSEWIHNGTSGSSGTPMEFVMDKSLTGRKISNYFRSLSWAGISPGDKYLKLWGPGGAGDFKKDMLTRYVLRRIELSCLQTDEMKQAYYDIIRRYKPKAIEAYVSGLVKLCLLMREDGVDDIHVPVATTSAETLYDSDRKVIEETLGCRVFNRYGSREFGIIAHECRAHEGLHINAESFHVEVVDPHTGEPCAAGERGEILVTCFCNFAMPFIRYRVQDMGVLSDQDCPCRMGLPKLASIEGRVTDFLDTSKKKMISYYNIEYFIRFYSDYIKDYQIVQNSPDSFVLRLVPTNKYSEDVAKDMVSKLSGYLEVADFTIEKVDRIEPGPSGKRRGVVGLKPAAARPS